MKFFLPKCKITHIKSASTIISFTFEANIVLATVKDEKMYKQENDITFLQLNKYNKIMISNIDYFFFPLMAIFIWNQHAYIYE